MIVQFDARNIFNNNNDNNWIQVAEAKGFLENAHLTTPEQENVTLKWNWFSHYRQHDRYQMRLTQT